MSIIRLDYSTNLEVDSMKASHHLCIFKWWKL